MLISSTTIMLSNLFIAQTISYVEIPFLDQNSYYWYSSYYFFHLK